MDDLENRHAAIWAAIDAIAERKGISPSRLAIISGHDKTAFNKSKRTKHGEPRWLSTETIAKVIAATGMTWAEFGRMVDKGG